MQDISAKIIDKASISKKPESHHIRLYSIIAFVLALVIAFLIYLYLSIIKGFNLSVDTLKDFNFDYAGKISFSCNSLEIEEINKSDLETLRKMIVSIKEHKVVTSISSKGPNYIHYLAALLAIIGKKVIVIETASKSDEKNGLFSYLERKTKNLPIETLQAYDFIPAGTKKYFSFELLNSEDFSYMIEDLKNQYDAILIYSDASVNSAESRIYLKLSDKIILTIKDEKLDDLKLFMEKHNSFVTY